ncbi:MAG: hypothetical protein C0502_07385 [Opitutus sp.]|nr:hypothetical protein [Opitutus sp.]
MERAARRSPRPPRQLPLTFQSHMKSKLLLALAALSCASGLAVQAADKKDGAEAKPDKKSRTITITRQGDDGEREKVTFLGVETGPVPRALAAHLGLERDLGLVVLAVADETPASDVLKENDVLTKLDDQLLVDSRQLSVLIRSKRPGTEVKLTIIRTGKEQVVTAKLGERELPRVFGLRLPDREGGLAFRFFNGEGGPAIERLRDLPGIAREELNDVLRIIGNDRPTWFAGPRVHVFNRKLKDGATILHMNDGNFAFTDDEGSIDVKASKGERQLIVKDKAGKVLFEAPINTDEQRDKLPAEVKERLKKLDTLSIDFEADESLEQEGATVKPPQKEKTSRRRESDREPGRSLRAF